MVVAYCGGDSLIEEAAIGTRKKSTVEHRAGGDSKLRVVQTGQAIT
jgi:hypothetical protein